MHLQTMTKATDNCFIFAAAMLLHVPPALVIKKIGHDGNDILFPNDKEPRRSVHIQEIQKVFLDYDQCLYQLDVFPKWFSEDGVSSKDVGDWKANLDYFWKACAGRRGILIGDCGEVCHAVGWDGYNIYDPKGHIRTPENPRMDIQLALLLGYL